MYCMCVFACCVVCIWNLAHIQPIVIQYNCSIPMEYIWICIWSKYQIRPKTYKQASVVVVHLGVQGTRCTNFCTFSLFIGVFSYYSFVHMYTDWLFVYNNIRTNEKFVRRALVIVLYTSYYTSIGGIYTIILYLQIQYDYKSKIVISMHRIVHCSNLLCLWCLLVFFVSVV